MINQAITTALVYLLLSERERPEKDTYACL